MLNVWGCANLTDDSIAAVVGKLVVDHCRNLTDLSVVVTDKNPKPRFSGVSWKVRKICHMELQGKLYTVGVVVLFFLICLSIFFETVQEHLVEHTRQNFKVVLSSLFSELTVLGFVSLCMFVTLKIPFISELSELLFDEEETVAEISELLHMVLFLVMLVHILQVCCLVFASGEGAKRMKNLEADCIDIETIMNKYVDELVTKRKDKKWWDVIPSEATTRLQYAALRHGFTHAAEVDDDDIRVPERTPNFDFSEYILILMGLCAAELIEVPVSTWISLQVLLILVWVYLLEVGSEHETFVIGTELVLLLITAVTWHKMNQVKESLTPRSLFIEAEKMATQRIEEEHAKERAKQLSRSSSKGQLVRSSSKHVEMRSQHSQDLEMQEETKATETTTLLKREEEPRLKRKVSMNYYSLKGFHTYKYSPADIHEHEHPTEEEHEELFWFKEHEFVPWILRLVMLVQAICVSISWCLMRQGGLLDAIRLFAMCTVLPVLSILYVIPVIVENYVVVTSVAPFKRPMTIAQVVRLQKLVRSFRSLQLGAIMMQYEEIKEDKPENESFSDIDTILSLAIKAKHFTAVLGALGGEPGENPQQRIASRLEDMPIERRIVFRHQLGRLLGVDAERPSTAREDTIVLSLQASHLFVGISPSALIKAVHGAYYKTYEKNALIAGPSILGNIPFVGVVTHGAVAVGGGNGAIELRDPRRDLDLVNELVFTENWTSLRAVEEETTICHIDLKHLKTLLTADELKLLSERAARVSEQLASQFKIQCLRELSPEHFGILDGFTPDEIAAFARSIWRFEYQKDDFVAKDEEVATMIYFVAKNAVEISLGSRKNPQVLGEIKIGGIMGESLLKTDTHTLDDQGHSIIQQRSADVVATQDGTALFALPKELSDAFRDKILLNARHELIRRQTHNDSLRERHLEYVKHTMDALTPKQHLEQWALFSVFDRDGDGVITRDEINSFLDKVGFAVKSDASVKAIQKSIHAFGDTITFAAFTTWILKQQKQAEQKFSGASEEHGITTLQCIMFDLVDEDRSGEITLFELQDLMKKLGEDFSLDELQMVILATDKSGDGKLDKEEFAQLLNNVGIS